MRVRAPHDLTIPFSIDKADGARNGSADLVDPGTVEINCNDARARRQSGALKHLGERQRRRISLGKRRLPLVTPQYFGCGIFRRSAEWRRAV